MADLTSAFLAARASKQSALDQAAGDRALAEFGTPPDPTEVIDGPEHGDGSPAGEGGTGGPGYEDPREQEAIRVNTDPAKIDTRGAEKRQLKTPPLAEVRKALGRGDQPLDVDAGPVRQDDGFVMDPAAKKVGEFILNSNDVEDVIRRLSTPEGISLLEGAGYTMPFLNSVLHTARTVLEGAGVPEPYTSVGEFISALLVPSRAVLGHTTKDSARALRAFGVRTAEELKGKIAGAVDAGMEGGAEGLVRHVTGEGAPSRAAALASPYTEYAGARRQIEASGITGLLERRAAPREPGAATERAFLSESTISPARVKEELGLEAEQAIERGLATAAPDGSGLKLTDEGVESVLATREKATTPDRTGAAYRAATESPEGFQRFLQRGEYAVLTAEKAELTPAENAARNEALMAELKRRGYQVIPAKGAYGATRENSFVVPGLSEDEALELGRQFQQESVLTPRGLVYTADGGVNPADLSRIDFSGTQEDYFTQVRIGDRDVKFTVPIDFENRLAPGEKTLRLEHYSPQRDLAKVEPEKFGSGQAGRERQRASDPGFRPRSYYYLEGTRPEARFAGMAKYTTEVPESKILDLGSPEGQALVAEAGGDLTKLENLAGERGFIGYRNSALNVEGSSAPYAQTPGNVIALFEPRSVRPAPEQGVQILPLNEGGFAVISGESRLTFAQSAMAPDEIYVTNLQAAKASTGDLLNLVEALVGHAQKTGAKTITATVVNEKLARVLKRLGVAPDYEGTGFIAPTAAGFSIPVEKLMRGPKAGDAVAMLAAVVAANSLDSDSWDGAVVGAGITANLKLLRGIRTGSIAGLMKLPAKIANALAADGFGKILRYGADFETWAKAMLKDHGQDLVPHLESVHKQSLKIMEDQIDGGLRKELLSTFDELNVLYDVKVNGAVPGITDWYGTPAMLRTIVGPDDYLVAGLLAATSPQQNAAKANIDAALAVYKILKTKPEHQWYKLISADNRKLTAHFGVSGKNLVPNVQRAIDMARLRAGQRPLWPRRKPELGLNGNKVNDFFGGLLGIEDVFPIDRHMVPILAPELKGAELLDPVYAGLSEWGKAFADAVGTTPKYAQQRLWVNYRALTEIDARVGGGNEVFYKTLLERAREQGILDLVPKHKLLGDEGRSRVAGLWLLGQAMTGAVVGGQIGDTPEERLNNALAGLGLGLAPAAVVKLAKTAVKNAPLLRNLVRKPTQQYPPQVAQQLERLFTGFESTLAWAKRGTRSHELAFSEAEQMIRSGQMSLDEVRAWFPGQTMNDSEAMALIKTVSDFGVDIQTYVASLSGKPALTPEDVDGLLQRLYTMREFLPSPAGIRSEAGRTLSAMNEPTAGYNAYLEQWMALFTDPDLGMSPEKLVEILSGFKRPDQFAAAARAMQQPGFYDFVTEALYGIMLGNPITLGVNGLMTTLSAAYAPIERLTAAAIGDTVRWTEPFAMLYGYLESLPTAFAYARHTMRTGERHIRGSAKVEMAPGPPQGKTAEWLERTWVGKIAETAVPLALGAGAYYEGVDLKGSAAIALTTHPRFWPLGPRILAATDELIKTMLWNGEKWAQAVRRGAEIRDPILRRQRVMEVVQNPNAIVKSQADAIANEFTFNAPPGPLVAGLMEGKNDPSLPGPYRLLATLAVPFINVPNNLFKFMGRRTPGLQQLHARWLSDLQSPGARQDTALGQLALGGAWIMTVAKAAAEGRIVGSGPADPNIYREWIADGNQEYSLVIGDTSLSLNRADPFGGMVSIIADWAAVAAHVDDATNDQIASALLMVVSKDMMSKTYFENGANVLEAITAHNPNKAYSFLQKSSGIAVPSLVKQLRGINDEHLREVRGLVDAAMDRVPELSKSLAPRKNIFADPIMRHEAIGYGIDYINPFRLKTKKNDPAAKAVLDNRISVSMPGWSIYGSKGKDWTLEPDRESVGIPLTAKQRDELIDLIGKPLKAAWLEFVNSPDYDKSNLGPDSANALVFRRLHRKFAEAGVKQLVDKYPLLQRDYETVLERRGLALEQPLAPRQLEGATR